MCTFSGGSVPVFDEVIISTSLMNEVINLDETAGDSTFAYKLHFSLQLLVPKKMPYSNCPNSVSKELFLCHKGLEFPKFFSYNNFN